VGSFLSSGVSAATWYRRKAVHQRIAQSIAASHPWTTSNYIVGSAAEIHHIVLGTLLDWQALSLHVVYS
jgi:hypothetical protein